MLQLNKWTVSLNYPSAPKNSKIKYLRTHVHRRVHFSPTSSSVVLFFRFSSLFWSPPSRPRHDGHPHPLELPPKVDTPALCMRRCWWSLHRFHRTSAIYLPRACTYTSMNPPTPQGQTLMHQRNTCNPPLSAPKQLSLSHSLTHSYLLCSERATQPIDAIALYIAKAQKNERMQPNCNALNLLPVHLPNHSHSLLVRSESCICVTTHSELSSVAFVTRSHCFVNAAEYTTHNQAV